MTISASPALRTVNFAVDEQSGTPFDVNVVRSSRTQFSLHNSKASEKFFASKANAALPSTSMTNTEPEKTVIDTHSHQHGTFVCWIEEAQAQTSHAQRSAQT